MLENTRRRVLYQRFVDVSNGCARITVLLAQGKADFFVSVDKSFTERDRLRDVYTREISN